MLDTKSRYRKRWVEYIEQDDMKIHTNVYNNVRDYNCGNTK